MVHLVVNMSLIEKRHIFKDIGTNFARVLKYPYDLISCILLKDWVAFLKIIIIGCSPKNIKIEQNSIV